MTHKLWEDSFLVNKKFVLIFPRRADLPMSPYIRPSSGLKRRHASGRLDDSWMMNWESRHFFEVDIPVTAQTISRLEPPPEDQLEKLRAIYAQELNEYKQETKKFAKVWENKLANFLSILSYYSETFATRLETSSSVGRADETRATSSRYQHAWRWIYAQ